MKILFLVISILSLTSCGAFSTDWNAIRSEQATRHCEVLYEDPDFIQNCRKEVLSNRRTQ